MIYFIQAQPSGYVKIGVANHVQRRLRTLQTGHAERLELIRSMPGDYAAESWLHNHFKSAHLRGEWFAFDPLMLSVDVPPEIKEPARTEGRISEIIAYLGGSTAVSRGLGHKWPTTVQGWKQREIIPLDQIPAVIAFSEQINKPLCHAHFFPDQPFVKAA